MATDSLQQIRDIVEGDCGYVRWIGIELEPEMPALSVAGSAEAILNGAIDCFLVAKDVEAHRLLKKAEAWLDTALARQRAGESLGGVISERAAPLNLSLCRWLSESSAGPPDWSRCVALLTAHVLTRPRHKLRQALDWALPVLLEAGEAGFCVEQFERYSPAFSLTTISRSGESGMAYVLAKGQTHPGLPVETDVGALAHDFLSRHLPRMLDEGEGVHCALWVKLLMSPQAGVKPGERLRQTVLKYVE